MKTRRLKVVSYLVLLTMIVSLFAPLGTMKKVMASGTSFIYSGGQWYEDFVQDDHIVANIQTSIQAAMSGGVMMIIKDHPQDAFTSLGTSALQLKTIMIEADPGSDFTIPATVTTEDMQLSYQPATAGTYQYTGNLGHVINTSGNLSITGNVEELTLGSSFSNQNQIHAGKVAVTGDVKDLYWYKKTEAIPSTDYIPGYGEAEVNTSIAHCDLPECEMSYYAGDLSLNGTITNLIVKELYYDATFNDEFLLTKKEVHNYTTPEAMTPVVTSGVLATDIPNENVITYTTTEWMNNFISSQSFTYEVRYDGTKYEWIMLSFVDGALSGEEKVLTLDEHNLPLNVDLTDADVTVFETDTNGLVFPDGVNLLRLFVKSGTVTVPGSVSRLDVEDTINSLPDESYVNVHVQGDVQCFYMMSRTENTNVTIDGDLPYGGLNTGYNNQAMDYSFSSFSKTADQSSEIVLNGSINPAFKLSTSEDVNEVQYTMNISLADYEAAAGITDLNRAKVFEGDTAYATVGTELYMRVLDDNMIQKVEDEVILDDGFHATKKAVDIKISTFYCNENNVYPGAAITSTSTEIPFTVTIPDYNSDFDYGIVRVHDNGDGTTSYDQLPSVVTNGDISFESDLFSQFVIISNEFIAPEDTTAPVLTNGAFERISHTEGTATFTSTEAGEFFYELVAEGEAEPEIDTDYDGEVCVAGSNSIVNPYGMEEGAMDLYVKVKDAAGNVSDTLKIGMAEYNSLPSFENSTVSINCSSTSLGLDITDFLAAIDDDNDQTLTWTMKQAPGHGKLTMTNATALSGGVNLIVDGSIVYQPDKNYCGTDQFVIRLSDGKATADCQVTMNVTDQTAPTATIKEGTNEWKSFLNTITFGLFFKNTVNVSITASDDGGSGLKSIEYYKSSTALTMEQIQELANWTTYTSAFSITPVDKNQVIIYAKVTDNAGNISYLCSNGMEFDLAAPSISNNYQKDATSMEVMVADDGSGLDTVSYTVDNGASQAAVVTNGKFTIPSLKEGRYNVVVTAKDKLGNISSQTIPVVSLYTVSFYYDELSKMPPFAIEIVEYGNDATAPIVAKRPGFDFVGWSRSFTKVVSDIDVEALWNLTGVTVTPYSGTYDGETHQVISIVGLNPSDEVTYSIDGGSYSTDCPSVTNAGSHSVYVKIDRDGLDTWTSPEYTVIVAKKAITSSMIGELATVEFNGEHFCPVPVVKDGSVTLKEGTDFTLTYLNNRNSGTALVNVIGKGNYTGDVQLSFRILEKKGEVKIKDDKTPQVAATNLNKLYEDEEIYTPEDRQIEENGGSVKLELSVQSQIVPIADQSKIKQMAKDKKIGLFLDISLFKTVQLAGESNGNTSQITHTNQLLSIVIPIPNELKGRKGIELYRVHNGVPTVIPVGAENAIDGEYCTIDSKNITLYVQNFSTYAIGYSTSDITSPKTGEESSQFPWILLGLGLVAAGVVVLKKGRRVRIAK